MKNSTSQGHTSFTRTRVYGPTSKHAANLRRNRTLHFQIGLILTLLVAILFIEMRTPQLAVVDKVVTKNEIEEPVYIDQFTMEQPKVEAKVTPTETEPLIDPIDPVTDIPIDNLFQNDDPIKETNVGAGDHTAITPIKPGDVDFVEEEETPVHITLVEFAPIFPGCEGLATNKERVSCFNEKVQHVVKKNFRTDIAEDLGVNGLQRIYAQFEVTKEGTVVLKNVRAPHPKLEKEAARVIAKLPEMQPGKMGAQEVGVLYSLPITFRVLD